MPKKTIYRKKKKNVPKQKNILLMKIPKINIQAATCTKSHKCLEYSFIKRND